MDDRRRSLRLVLPAGEEIEIQVMGRGFLDVLTAKDISADGMGIYCRYPLPEDELGRELELIVTIPSLPPFRARGIIRHLGGEQRDSVGLQFTELSSEARAVIEQFISRQGAAR